MSEQADYMAQDMGEYPDSGEVITGDNGTIWTDENGNPIPEPEGEVVWVDEHGNPIAEGGVWDCDSGEVPEVSEEGAPGWFEDLGAEVGDALDGIFPDGAADGGWGGEEPMAFGDRDMEILDEAGF
ncbi:MAG: hypothetical protein ACRD0U_11390 [Acidimicrobiales bacterium]